MLCRLFLTLSLKFFLAFRTGDHNFALAPGYTHRLAAFGTVKIPMIPVFDTIKEHQKPTVFPISLISISGKCAKYRPDHQAVRQHGQCQIHCRNGHKNGDNAQYHSSAQYPHIQFIRPVTAHHKTLNPLSDATHLRKSPSLLLLALL